MGTHLYSSFLWKHGIDKELGSEQDCPVYALFESINSKSEVRTPRLYLPETEYYWSANLCLSCGVKTVFDCMDLSQAK